MPARVEKEAYEEYELAAKPAPPPRLRQRERIRTCLDEQMRRRCKTLLIVLAVMAMTITVRSGISASRGYDLVHTEQQAEAVEQENERLKIDIARLKSPQRIKDIATKDLGMEVPQQVYFVHAKKGQ